MSVVHTWARGAADLVDMMTMDGNANHDAADRARATVLRDGTFTGSTRHTCSQ